MPPGSDPPDWISDPMKGNTDGPCPQCGNQENDTGQGVTEYLDYLVVEVLENLDHDHSQGPDAGRRPARSNGRCEPSDRTGQPL